jgi:DNA-binding transcriptional LysR family regulator
LSPTEAGSVYFQRIEPLIEEITQAQAAVLDVSTQPKGWLRVTASVSFGHKRIVPLLPAFAARYPELTVDLVLTDAVLDLIAERIDIAIRLGSALDPGLIAQQLIRTPYCVCASPAYLEHCGRPERPTDLQDHNCLLFPLADFRTRWIFRDSDGGLSEAPVAGRLLISSGIGLQQCALAGMGIALLPRWLIEDDLRAGALVNVFPAYEVTATDFDSAAWIVYSSRSYVPLKVRAFIEHLKEHVAY